MGLDGSSASVNVVAWRLGGGAKPDASGPVPNLWPDPGGGGNAGGGAKFRAGEN
jgi:hypothetical protein